MQSLYEILAYLTLVGVAILIPAALGWWMLSAEVLERKLTTKVVILCAFTFVAQALFFSLAWVICSLAGYADLQSAFPPVWWTAAILMGWAISLSVRQLCILGMFCLAAISSFKV